MISGELQGVADLIEDSNVRRQCMQAKWERKVRQVERARKRNQDSQGVQHRHDPVRRTRASAKLAEAGFNQEWNASSSTDNTMKSRGNASNVFDSDDVAATQRETIQWLGTYPITNETTHFAVVMDPTEGRIAWVRRYLEPYMP